MNGVRIYRVSRLGLGLGLKFTVRVRFRLRFIVRFGIIRVSGHVPPDICPTCDFYPWTRLGFRVRDRVVVKIYRYS